MQTLSRLVLILILKVFVLHFLYLQVDSCVFEKYL